MNNHSYTSDFESYSNLPQSFQHETIMALVGLRPVLADPEEYEDGFSQPVGRSNRVFQGVVILRPLGRLHPIEHVQSVADLLVVQNFDPFRLNHLNT